MYVLDIISSVKHFVNSYMSITYYHLHMVDQHYEALFQYQIVHFSNIKWAKKN